MIKLEVIVLSPNRPFLRILRLTHLEEFKLLVKGTSDRTAGKLIFSRQRFADCWASSRSVVRDHHTVEPSSTRYQPNSRNFNTVEIDEIRKQASLNRLTLTTKHKAVTPMR